MAQERGRNDPPWSCRSPSDEDQWSVGGGREGGRREVGREGGREGERERGREGGRERGREREGGGGRGGDD